MSDEKLPADEGRLDQWVDGMILGLEAVRRRNNGCKRSRKGLMMDHEKLNDAVHEALGYSATIAPPYSTDWTHGGPIIERFGICLTGRKTISDPLSFSQWTARIEGKNAIGFIETGQTPLIAAMLAFVASMTPNTKLGTR